MLTELVEIAEWLGRSRPRAGLWPSDPGQEERALEIMRHVTRNIHGEGFARIFVSGAFSADPGEGSQIVEEGKRIAAHGLATAARMIAPEGYALGKFSVADPVLFYVEFWADKTGVTLPDRLLAHYRLMLGRDAVYRVLREEGYDPDKLGLAA